VRLAAVALCSIALGCHEGNGLQDAAVPGADMRRAESVVFAAIGDFGDGSGHELDVSAMVKRWHPDFIITMGDNNYPSGDRGTIDMNIGKFYSDYIGGYMGHFGMGSPINLFFPCVGNHDWYDPEKLQPYLDYFSALPGNKRYYDFRMGLVHFYVLDSDPNEPDGTAADSVQGKWLQQALAAPTPACYRVVYFHHPPYSSGDYPGPWMRWPFAAWGADVILSGHDHLYERLSVDGIPYLINGVGGAGLFGYPNNRQIAESQFRFIDPHTNITPDWGAQLVTATKTGMTFDFFDVDGGAAIIDSITVTPRAACP
jgi:tartrate-resistant acid phosphatase type 5